MIKVFWRGKGHTVCRRATGFSTTMPLWAFNLSWWRGSICRVCVPDPVMAEPKNNYGWPW